MFLMKSSESHMNICLITAQRVLDLFNEAGLSEAEREATVEILVAMVRASVSGVKSGDNQRHSQAD
jgi:hypothetical protein